MSTAFANRFKIVPGEADMQEEAAKEQHLNDLFLKLQSNLKDERVPLKFFNQLRKNIVVRKPFIYRFRMYMAH
jgi:hypothetical protein